MKHLLSLFAFLACAGIANAQTGILEDFNQSTLSAGWNNVGTNLTLSIENQELRLNGSTSGFNNIEFNFPTIDISANQTVQFDIRTSQNVNIRIDLIDAQGRGTNGNPVSTGIIAASSNMQTITLDYTNRFTTNTGATVNNNAITKAVFFFNAGATFNGTIFIDDLSIGDPIKLTPGLFVLNQVGYDSKGVKTALFKTSISENEGIDHFEIINEDNEVVYTNDFTYKGAVNGWGSDVYWEADFTAFNTRGTYRIKIGENRSVPFEIGDDFLFTKSAASVIGFFNGMRHVTPGDENLSFNGPRNDQVDVSGGWWDATGDPGKHFSHLSYANYFNPQQIPMVVWSMLKSTEWAKDAYVGQDQTALYDEIYFGLDYLMRNLDDEGYFYLAIFDDWGNAPFSREICEWGVPGNNAGRTADYQCAMREGGGLAIAALAKAATMNITNNQYTVEQLTAAAEKAYAHLKSLGDGYATKNLEYCNNHIENIIDDYCGLLAAIELYKATEKEEYLNDAIQYAQNIQDKQQTAGWLAADTNGERPFFHAADEGLPVMAMYEYTTINPSAKEDVQAFMQTWLTWYQSIAHDVNNPYNYAREYVRDYNDNGYGNFRTSFFVPQENETGYWWQGENARLSSMSSAVMIAAHVIDPNFRFGNDTINRFAQAQLDWIMGKNPFSVCMLYGFGTTNYIDYPSPGSLSNIVGGICNGITAEEENPAGIAWRPYGDSEWQNWRWTEQWLPHNAWYLIAISTQYYLNHLPELPDAPIAKFAPIPNEICINNSIVLTSTSENEISEYIWYIGEEVINGQGPHTVELTSSGEIIVALKVTGPGGTDSTANTINVKQLPIPYSNGIAGDTILCLNEYAIYIVEYTTNASYTWNVPAGLGFVSGSGSNEINVIADEIITGQISVTVTNECEQSSTFEINVSVDVCTSTGNTTSKELVNIYPNPTNGKISFTDTMHQIELYDAKGLQLLQIEQANSIDLNKFESGLYLLKSDEGVFRLMIE